MSWSGEWSGGIVVARASLIHPLTSDPTLALIHPLTFDPALAASRRGCSRFERLRHDRRQRASASEQGGDRGLETGVS